MKNPPTTLHVLTGCLVLCVVLLVVVNKLDNRNKADASQTAKTEHTQQTDASNQPEGSTQSQEDASADQSSYSANDSATTPDMYELPEDETANAESGTGAAESTVPEGADVNPANPDLPAGSIPGSITVTYTKVTSVDQTTSDYVTKIKRKDGVVENGIYVVNYQYSAGDIAFNATDDGKLMDINSGVEYLCTIDYSQEGLEEFRDNNPDKVFTQNVTENITTETYSVGYFKKSV